MMLSHVFYRLQACFLTKYVQADICQFMQSGVLFQELADQTNLFIQGENQCYAPNYKKICDVLNKDIHLMKHPMAYYFFIASIMKQLNILNQKDPEIHQMNRQMKTLIHYTIHQSSYETRSKLEQLLCGDHVKYTLAKFRYQMKKQKKTPDVLLAIKSFFTMVIELFFDPKMSRKNLNTVNVVIHYYQHVTNVI